LVKIALSKDERIAAKKLCRFYCEEHRARHFSRCSVVCSSQKEELVPADKELPVLHAHGDVWVCQINPNPTGKKKEVQK
jgi:hypothetical protein